MGTIHPGDWKQVGVRNQRSMDPESARRLASGFWKHDYDHLTDTVTWVCNKRKLNDKLAEAMLDREFAHRFTQGGLSILNRMFGEGTVEAFRHSGGDHVKMRFDPFRERYTMGMDLARGKDMALYSQFNNCTTTSGTTTSGGWARKTTKTMPYKAPSKAPDRLVRNLPFVNGGADDLVNTLQREFNHWAGLQMMVIRSAQKEVKA